MFLTNPESNPRLCCQLNIFDNAHENKVMITKCLLTGILSKNGSP